MKINLFYYSGAGNTKYIANKIKKRLLDLSYEVNMMHINDKNSVDYNQNADAYIIGFPVYDLSAPLMVQDLVNNLKEQKKPISYFCTKAFLSVNSIKELHDVSTAKGLSTVATLDLFMPATDALALFAKRDSRTEKILKSFHSKHLDKKVESFISKFERNNEIRISNKRYSYLGALIPKKAKQSFHDQYTVYIPQFYSKTDVCIECMLCVKGCPRDNIRFEDGIKFEQNCDMCLACLHHCPVDSIQLGDFTKDTVRLRKIEINDN